MLKNKTTIVVNPTEISNVFSEMLAHIYAKA